MRRTNLGNKTILGLILSTCFAVQSADADTLLLRQPSVSRDHLAFVYAGDIWLTSRSGQNPVRLTTHPASEFSPKFSPDGKWLAYSASYDNNTDVYVIPVDGGEARRLTWHPGQDVVVGWSADGKRVLFASNREIANSRSNQLYEVPLEGGYEKKVMEAIAFEGNWSGDGKYLAYRPFRQAYSGPSGWRLHRGGTTPPIWIMDVANNKLEKIPHDNANDSNPVWVGDEVFFISDRDNKVANLFAYNRNTKAVRQVTRETTWDIRNISASGNSVVYEAGGELKEFDAATGKTQTIHINLEAQTTLAIQARPQWKDASSTITSANLSPTGKRVVLSARGEVFTVPVKDGSVRNLTESSGIREKDGLWSPDGKRIAYISDVGRQHRLVLRDQAGLDQAKTLSLGQSGYYTLLAWSPDNQMIVYQDNHLQLYVIHLNNGSISKIDASARRSKFNVSFSSDSKWLAYTVVGANHFSQIKLHDFTTAKNTSLTDGMSHADHPVFAAADYLYFTASINAGPTQVGLDMSTQERPLRNGLYVAVLAADGKSPLLPKTGDEGSNKDDEKKDELKKEAAKDPAKDAAKDKDASKDAAAKVIKPVKIDLAGLPQRIAALPVAERNYDNLAVASDGSLFYLEHRQPGVSHEPPANKDDDDADLMRFSFEDKKAKSLRQGIASFSLSADGKKILIQYAKSKLDIGDAGEKLDAKPIDLSQVRMQVNPREEWEQIFNETWWMEKEFFYDANLHGIDWDAIYTRYHALLKHVQRREDLNELLVEMIGELQVGHNRTGGGDVYQEKPVAVGLLGADYSYEQGHYRIKTIYRGDRWNPFLAAPLAAPGMNIKEGDYLLAINGKALDKGKNLYSLLANTVGKQVTLTVAGDLTNTPGRHVIVQPVANETALRQWHWIEKNREYVQKKTDGKVAYVYLPDTGSDGYQYFNRMFYAQADKSALIIDERRNGGGQAANYITDILNRQYLASWKDRDGLLFTTPGAAIYGPKAMLIDQDAGSGGDFLPYSFKRLGLGTLIGKRTWGGLIGISANPELIDGGFLLVPFFRFFTPEGEWRIENEGVSPDIDVELDPTEVNAGKDTQLDAAIQNVMQKLQTYQAVQRQQTPTMPKLGK
ncbi:PDZ domain-containing protein [Undibacterium sp. Jales W-56]|uniref:S41 family peptidase n=1 Tax=Undibacterium sp. Jales W-56 TaxID=2897325 RepID=UPI0021D35A86|nr:S41 family peptidase [Undibacterium sp. Jales W-56]MCU6433828.1 PDZ domain-containing protein [Undibacterium sp. Jales W-56]